MMDFGGIIAGALGGGAKAAGELADTAIQTQNKRTLEQEASDIALQRQKALLALKGQQEDEDRATRAAAINSGAQGIIARQQADRLNNFYNKGGDGTVQNLGPDDYSDEEKAMAPPSERDQAVARLRAAADAGYLDPNQEAALGLRQDALDSTNQRLQDKLASDESIAQDRILSAERNTDVRIQAAIDKAVGSGSDGAKKDRLTTIVNSMNATIKNLADGDRGRTPEAKAAWQRQYDDAVALRDAATAQLKTSMLGTQPTQSPSGKVPAASTAGSRADVQNAVKLWNNQGR